MVNVTVGSNGAVGADGSASDGVAQGGGIYIAGDEATSIIVNAAIIDNYLDGANASGAGIHDAGGPTTIRNTMIASNTVGVGNVPGNCGGPGLATWVSDHNLRFGDTTCPSSGFITADPQLGEADQNGGPTATLLPAPTGAGVDAGTCYGALSPKDDQRGYVRPSGDTCDIGPVEIFSPVRSVSPSNPATRPGATRRGSGGSTPTDPTPNRRT
jgi:hypothetical protein